MVFVVVVSVAPNPAEQQITVSGMVGFKGSEAIFIWVFFYKKAFLLPLCFMFRVSKEWC